MQTRAFIALGALVLACASQQEQPAATGFDASTQPQTQSAAVAPVETSAEVEAPVIGRVRMRDATLTMHATGRGPRFSLAARDGTVIERGMDERALAARHPEVHAVYGSALAQQPFVDARLDLAEEPAPGFPDARAPRR